jgi:hypothetical protein
VDVTQEHLRAARDRYDAATREYAAAGQARLELFAAAVAAGWNSLDAAGELGIAGLYIDPSRTGREHPDRR